MKGDFASDFEKTLKKMSWPGEKLRLDEGLEHAWQTGVEKLLDLQEPYVKIFHPAGLIQESTDRERLEIYATDIQVFSSSLRVFSFLSLLYTLLCVFLVEENMGFSEFPHQITSKLLRLPFSYCVYSTIPCRG